MILFGLLADVAAKTAAPFLSRFTLDRVIPQKNLHGFFLVVAATVALMTATGLLSLLRGLLSYRVLMRPLLQNWLRIFRQSLLIDQHRDPSLSPAAAAE